MKKKDIFRQDQFIARWLAGELDDREYSDFRRWLEDHPADRAYFDELKQLWKHSSEIDIRHKLSRDQRWKKLSNRLNDFHNRQK